MQITLCDTKPQLGQRGADQAAAWIREALRERGRASIITATGASQFEMIAALVKQPDIDWTRVTAFHLDEYIGIPITHPASFRKFLWERLVSKLPLPLAAFHYISPENGPSAECKRLGRLIGEQQVDVAFVGIGENGHLAFNDPPADFDTDEPYLVVNLDEACRKQQLGEGWFPTLADVPTQAISMSIRQIMKTRAIVCTVPDARKAAAVQRALEGPVTNRVPASILRTHSNIHMLLDPESSALLKAALTNR